MALLAAAAAVSPCCAQFAPFTQEAAARGITHPVETPQFLMFGAGLGFADLDGDGDPDLLALGRLDGRVGLWENDGTGRFLNRQSGSGIEDDRFLSGVSFADYDGDSDTDMYLSSHGTPSRLLRNDGGFHFTDVAAAAGVANIGAGQGSDWADFNADGRLDLYVANRTFSEGGFPAENRLYRNNGDGTFTDVAVQLGVSDPVAMSFQPAFLDFDRDGDADLYIAEDKGLPACLWTNRLWRNDGGVFTDISESSGAGACMNGMCVAVADLDRDERSDLFVTNTQEGNVLLMAQPDGRFTDRSDDAGVVAHELGWGSQFLDFDNDGRTDLFMCNEGWPNRLYRQGPAWPLEDVGSRVGLALLARSYCCAAADVDHDGDLDLAVSSLNRSLRLYINHEGESRHWVKLRIVNTRGIQPAFGAIVRITAGGIVQTAELRCSSGFKSQNESVVHLGLGAATAIDTVTVTWPNGGGTRTLTGLSSDRTWIVHPPSSLGDADSDGVMTSQDFFEFLACFFDAVNERFRPGCDMMDMDGDGRATSQDYVEFLEAFFR